MTEGFVQVPTDSVGKKIKTIEVTDSQGNVYEIEQVYQINSPQDHLDLLRSILVELRLMNTLVAQGLNIRDDIDAMRVDFALQLGVM